jgi:glycosyltransferase involved in cell wall biosynthesis
MKFFDNSANKFFDFLAAGRPIAINYGGWQAELLRSTGAGIVLDPVDIETAATMLKEKLDDETWLQESRRAARILAKEQFDREKLARKLCEAIVMGKKDPQGEQK